MEGNNIPIANLEQKLQTNLQLGLTSVEAAKRLAEFGENKLKDAKKRNIILRVIDQLKDFMVIILLIAAAVSFGMSIIEGSHDYADPIIIIFIVMLNAILGVVQESKAEKAIAALQKMTAPTAKVIRDGQIQIISGTEVVVGDVLVLETGDFVACDARLVESSSLQVEESSITGESIASHKDHTLILKSDIGLGDNKNMVLGTTLVTYGRGKAVAVATGMDIEVGKIAQMLLEHKDKATPLQNKLSGIGKLLGITALSICGLIFVIGVLRKIAPFEMFMTSISLAVAAIPEGLPAIVTIMLALGVQRMSKKNAIVRKIPAVETLGRATVICSDKTGTLTQNKMTVVEHYTASGMSDRNLFELASLCCNVRTNSSSGTNSAIGTPTELAIYNAAIANQIDSTKLNSDYTRIDEIPFESKRKLMTTIHKTSNGYRIITKGAIDMLLNKCSNAIGISKPPILHANNQMADKALRVIAVAYKDVASLPSTINSDNVENNLIFAGLIGMIDPPRPEVRGAIKICRAGGIKPVMITGDHIATAKAIARDIGIFRENDKALTGIEIDKMGEVELTKRIYEFSVFARVSPENKVQIVRAFQNHGAIVAMTGDGVNDAPALKCADIGCAMGISGTDVAKGASDMILTDDNFATITMAIKEGRGIYANIKKAIHFLLSSNIGEIITIFAIIMLGLPTPLLAIHLLWVNLVTDSLPAVALGLEQTEKDIMTHPPISPKEGIFAHGLGLKIVIQGFMIGGLAVFAFLFGLYNYSLVVGRTMSFAVLSISQLVHAFNIRSDKSIFEVGIFANMYMIGAFVICFLLQFSVINIYPLSQIFKVVQLDLQQWILVLSLSFAPLVLIEIVKLFKSIFLHSSQRVRI